MWMAFEGKSVVVTGGASGIGKALSAEFAARGASVVVADIDGAGAEKVARVIGGVSFKCDVGSEDSIRALIDHAVDLFGGIDVMFSNAGIAPVCDLNAPSKLWDMMWRVNFMAHVHAAKYAIPHDLPLSEWPKICFGIGHEGGMEWRGSTSPKG